jgi:hypothetical protein
MASTTPPEEPRDTSPTLGFSNFPSGARLPIPGNAELGIWILALIFGAIVVAIADKLTNQDWWLYFTVTSVAYLLSRGIAKASRVLEQ